MSESVGNAYVNIVPKIDGDAKSVGNNFGNAVSGGMKGAISAGAVAIGNILSNVVQSAASAVADQFQAAMQNAMDYEQLAGGAKKIFDEVDYSTIAKDAQQAYKTLNMSANEYLASINQVGAAFAQTMGDQKGYEIAKTGMTAISDYASGTGRNLEELNEKYALITRSTSSYQSIADQFSGILPATSADFLEQAQAAGFLSDEYTKLTEVPVAEYQEAVTKMLEKGVADMGLAGNTFEESTKTMSGSLAMLKSAWDNFLTALNGGEGLDLSQVTNDLLNAIGAVAQNIIPALVRIGASIAVELPAILRDAFSNVAPTVREALSSAFGENAATIFDQFINLLNTVGQTVSGVIDYISGYVQAIMPVIQNVIMPIVEVIASNVIARTNDILTVINGIIGFLSSTLLPAIQAVSSFIASTVGPVVQDIANVIVSNMPTIQSVFTQATQAIGSIVQAVWPVVQSIITAVANAVRAVISAVWPVIQNIIVTVFNAIRSVTQAVWPVISGAVSTAANVIRSAINGLQTIVGGVRSAFNAVRSAICDPIEAARNAVGSAIDAIKGFFAGLHLEIPLPRVPRIDVDGGEAPWGIGGQGRLPSFNVYWAARGAFLNGATLVGAGEKGTEMILPKSGGLMNDFAEAVTERVSNDAVVAELRDLRSSLGYIIANSAPTATPRELKRINQKVNAYA